MNKAEDEAKAAEIQLKRIRQWRVQGPKYVGMGFVSSWLDKELQRPLEEIELLRFAWEELVGEDIADMSQLLSAKRGMLYVRVANSTAQAMLIKQEKQGLLAQLAQKSGTKVLRRIKYYLGNIDKA